jgi:hypothetical protein
LNFNSRQIKVANDDIRNQDVTGTPWSDEPASPFSPRSVRSRLPAMGFYLCSRQLKVASDGLLFSFTSTQGWQLWAIIFVLVTLYVTGNRWRPVVCSFCHK